MRRLILRWLALLAFVAVIAVACVLLGRWQLSRLEERRVANEQIQTRENAPPVPYDRIFGGRIAEDQQWQRVTVTGTYDGQRQFVVRLRTQADQPGIEVVTPLHTADGQTVLINRGFLAASRNAPPPAPPPAPTGEVTVVGFVQDNEVGRTGATVPVDGMTRLVNAEGIGQALPYPILDGWISLQTSDPPEPELKPLTLPELNDGPHFWYAVQWFMFGSIGLLGLFVFVRGDLRERRARIQDTPPATVAETATGKG